MIGFEQVTPQLMTARNAYPEHAAQLAQALDALPLTTWRGYPETGMHFIGDIGHVGEGDVISGYRLGRVLEGLLGEIALLPEFVDKKNLFINRQSPGASQGFHFDHNQEMPVDVFQLSDNGRFDYRTYALDEESAVGLPVNQGDVVRILSGRLSHRGANPSGNTRYTLVISNPTYYLH